MTSRPATMVLFMSRALYCTPCERSAIVDSRSSPARDHRVQQLPRAIPVRRRSLRAEALEKDQVREMRDRVRDSQSGVRVPARRGDRRPDLREAAAEGDHDRIADSDEG